MPAKIVAATGFWMAGALMSLALIGTTVAVAKTPAEAFAAHTAGSTATVDHAAFDRILKSYARQGDDGIVRVAYARLKAEAAAELKAYLAALQAVRVGSLDRPEQFAFWANLYNAKTLDIVVDHIPVRSIKDIALGGGLLAAVTGGPWKAKVLSVSGMDLSLDDIEHGILRPLFKDPRVHYAVNCASLGCPNLALEAFSGARLDDQLQTAARAFVNHSRAVGFEQDQLVVSSIYHWFQDDFGGSDAAVIAHLSTYADAPLKARLKSAEAIADHRYDWTLNDLPASPAPARE